MSLFTEICNKYNLIDTYHLDEAAMDEIEKVLKTTSSEELRSFDDGSHFIDLVRKYREKIAINNKRNGENFTALLNSLLSVGEDGVYSDSLRFIFELIQNVDDCDYADEKDRMLDMRFDFHSDRIILTYNEIGFSPFCSLRIMVKKYVLVNRLFLKADISCNFRCLKQLMEISRRTRKHIKRFDKGPWKIMLIFDLGIHLIKVPLIDKIIKEE